MRPTLLLAAIVICAMAMLGGTAPAAADVRILRSPGGEVGSFLRLFSAVRDSGERVIIDGPCYSACTLVLGMVPNDRICVTRRAVLGFHGARVFDRAGKEYRVPPSVNARVVAAYPEPVQQWIAQRGGLTRKLIKLRGAELYQYYPRCA